MLVIRLSHMAPSCTAAALCGASECKKAIVPYEKSTMLDQCSYRSYSARSTAAGHELYELPYNKVSLSRNT